MLAPRSGSSAFLILALALAAGACSTPKATGATQPQASAPQLPSGPAKVSPPRVVNGGLARIEITLPTAESGSSTTSPPRAIFGETIIPLFREGDQWVGWFGVPYEQAAGAAVVEITAGDRKFGAAFDVADGQYSSEALTVDPRRVNPSPKDMKRIKREGAEVSAIYRQITQEKFWTGRFVAPVDNITTSPFGGKRTYNGELRSFHPGLDFRAAVGTPILAPAPGRVVMAKNLFFTGWTVMLDHGYGIYTLYAHMSKIQVKRGQRVETGKRLGLSGATGRVSGPHLHWGAIVNHVKVNPMDLLQVMK